MVKPLVYGAYGLFLRAEKRCGARQLSWYCSAAPTYIFFVERRSKYCQLRLGYFCNSLQGGFGDFSLRAPPAVPRVQTSRREASPRDASLTAAPRDTLL